MRNSKCPWKRSFPNITSKKNKIEIIQNIQDRIFQKALPEEWTELMFNQKNSFSPMFNKLWEKLPIKIRPPIMRKSLQFGSSRKIETSTENSRKPIQKPIKVVNNKLSIKNTILNHNKNSNLELAKLTIEIISIKESKEHTTKVH